MRPPSLLLLLAVAETRYLRAVSCFPPSFIGNPNITFRLIDVTVTFQLNGINLQTVRLRELPDCYTFNITVRFDPVFAKFRKEIKDLVAEDLICLKSG